MKNTYIYCRIALHTLLYGAVIVSASLLTARYYFAYIISTGSLSRECIVAPQAILTLATSQDNSGIHLESLRSFSRIDGSQILDTAYSADIRECSVIKSRNGIINFGNSTVVLMDRNRNIFIYRITDNSYLAEFTIPADVMYDRIEAYYSNGVATLLLTIIDGSTYRTNVLQSTIAAPRNWCLVNSTPGTGMNLLCSPNAITLCYDVCNASNQSIVVYNKATNMNITIPFTSRGLWISDTMESCVYEVESDEHHGIGEMKNMQNEIIRSSIEVDCSKYNCSRQAKNYNIAPL